MIVGPAASPALPRYIPWSRAYIPFALAAVLVLVDIGQRGGNLSHFQILGIANSALPLALVGMGEAIVILTNGIDLSVGAIVGLATGIVAVVDQAAGILGIVAALAAGCVAGLINGLLVSFGRMASLIVTLATGSIFGGFALLVLPSPGGVAPSWLYHATVGSLGAVPVATLWLVALVILGWLILRRTSFGIFLQCLGSSETASWAAGVPTRRTTLLAYMSSGLFAALAGVTLAGLTGSGDPNIGNIYILNAIAVVVVGGDRPVRGTRNPFGHGFRRGCPQLGGLRAFYERALDQHPIHRHRRHRDRGAVGADHQIPTNR